MVHLDEIASRRTLRLTTVGRRSGQDRTVEVWFIVVDGAIVVQAGPKGQKGWLANVRANPEVKIDLAGQNFAGRAELLPEREQERFAQLFRRKYWVARLAGWFGSPIGQGKPVRIDVKAG